MRVNLNHNDAAMRPARVILMQRIMAGLYPCVSYLVPLCPLGSLLSNNVFPDYLLFLENKSGNRGKKGSISYIIKISRGKKFRNASHSRFRKKPRENQEIKTNQEKSGKSGNLGQILFDSNGPYLLQYCVGS